eukprot:GHVN01040156.1.p1 GENE.GHVN01040156.1~~GHVN01040156.1.p1  ORF type:complete len:142 (+),score=23.58 GHVN01040156.1:260-685(+)
MPSDMTSEEVYTLFSPFGRLTCYGCSRDGQPVEISYQTAQEARKAMEEMNGMVITTAAGTKSRELSLVSTNATKGPDYISHYDFPPETFDPFIEKVTLIKVEYEDDSETHGYYETRAIYEVLFTKDEYAEHLKTGAKWYGR